VNRRIEEKKLTTEVTEVTEERPKGFTVIRIEIQRA